MEDIEKLKLEVLETPFSGDVKEKFCRALEVTSEERKGVHGLDEQIKVESLKKGLIFYENLLEEL